MFYSHQLLARKAPLGQIWYGIDSNNPLRVFSIKWSLIYFIDSRLNELLDSHIGVTAGIWLNLVINFISFSFFWFIKDGGNNACENQ